MSSGREVNEILLTRFHLKIKDTCLMFQMPSNIFNPPSSFSLDSHFESKFRANRLPFVLPPSMLATCPVNSTALSCYANTLISLHASLLCVPALPLSCTTLVQGFTPCSEVNAATALSGLLSFF